MKLKATGRARLRVHTLDRSCRRYLARGTRAGLTLTLAASRDRAAMDAPEVAIVSLVCVGYIILAMLLLVQNPPPTAVRESRAD